MLVKARFSIHSISELLHVSSWTVKWQMQEYGLSVHSLYTEIQDNELDDIVRATKRTNPKCGSKMLMRYLGSKGIFVPKHHERSSFKSNNPQGVVTWWCTAIKWCVYNITRPLRLWHFDGNHKLVKWHFVVHRWEEGFTPVYLPCNANNKAATVFSNFIKAENWGLPSRTRCDVERELRMWMLSSMS